jgi:hypothetical protein
LDNSGSIGAGEIRKFIRQRSECKVRHATSVTRAVQDWITQTGRPGGLKDIDRP